MVTEWEKEELGRLTHQRLKTLSSHQQEQQEQQQQAGRMTLQNIESMKIAHKQSDTKEAKIKMLIERLKLAITTSISGLFAPSEKKIREDRCKVYGHNLPFGSSWQGAYPRCHDCGEKITDPSTLRGAVPFSEREKFRSYGE